MRLFVFVLFFFVFSQLPDTRCFGVCRAYCATRNKPPSSRCFGVYPAGACQHMPREAPSACQAWAREVLPRPSALSPL